MAGNREIGAAAKPSLPRRSSAVPPRDPATALGALGLAAYVWDPATDAIAWSARADAIFGAPPPPSGRTFAAATGHRAWPPRGEGDGEGTGIPYRHRFTLRLPAGSACAVEEIGRWFPGPKGGPAMARGTLRREAVAVPTSRTSGLRAEAARALAEGRETVLLHVALDEDRADGTAAAAHRIRAVMRRRDRLVVGPEGGLAVLLGGCGAGQAAMAATRVLDALRGGGLRVRLGVACAPLHALDAETLIHRAEEALARAASDALSFPPARDSAPDEPAQDDDLAVLAALNGRRIGLAARGVAETRRRAPILETVRAALDARLVELAAARLLAVPDARLCVPLAPATLADPGSLAMLAAHLGARPGVAERLLLGFDEAALAADMPSAVARCAAMKALGAGIAILGFGAGHLGPAEVAALSADAIWLEEAFVQAAHRSPDDRLYLRILLAAAHGLDIPVTAPGVHDEDTARLLADLGCDRLEGALFDVAPPGAASATAAAA